MNQLWNNCLFILIEAEIVRLNSILASRFSNSKPSQLWNNIRSLVLDPTKCNAPNINADALNTSFFYGPTDTAVDIPPPLLNSSVFFLNPPPIGMSCHSYTASNWILPWNSTLSFKKNVQESFVPSSLTPLTPHSLRLSCLHLERHPYHATPQEAAFSLCTTQVSANSHHPYWALHMRAIHSRSDPTFLEKSNDQNHFAYKKVRSMMDAVGLVAHTIHGAYIGTLGLMECQKYVLYVIRKRWSSRFRCTA